MTSATPPWPPSVCLQRSAGLAFHVKFLLLFCSPPFSSSFSSNLFNFRFSDSVSIPMEEGQARGCALPPMEADVEWWSGAGRKTEAAARPLKVQFSEPAKHWTDAFPIGNGPLGAMVWGGVDTEILQLNHDTLWTGVPSDQTNPNVPALVSKVRKLVDSGQYVEASTAASDLAGPAANVYQPLGNININFSDSHYGYKAYERELDLNTATVNVKYTLGGVEFTREHFSSNPHQVIVTKISANKSGCVSFVVFLDSPLNYHSSAYNATRIIMEGSCPGKRIQPQGNESGNPSGIRFSAVLDLQIGGNGGKVQVLDSWKLKVEGADWAVLLLAASSSFEGPFTKPSDSKEDPTSVCLKTLSSIRNVSYSQLLAYHLSDYQNLFHRVTLQLSKASSNALEEKRLAFLNQTPVQNNPESDWGVSTWAKTKLMDSTFKPTPERVKSFKDDEDPSLVELLFQYGRYLLISCSRPGTQVANLQGIWNKETQPKWDAAPHLNINLEMNYWPSLSCNLSECQEPLIDFIASLAVNGSKTAKVNYEASGWVTHHVADIWAKTSPDQGKPVAVVWPMGGAWLCTHLWEHYSFTMDKGFLENKAYPLLEGCASFLLDWLIEGRAGYLKTNPSTSPEHYFIAPDGKTASVSYSTTMDMAIIREVFSAVVSSAEVLGRSESDFIKQIKKALSRLPPTKIASDGSIMEWAQEFKDSDVHHRHLSHLFGLFPGHSITIEQAPDLCKAAANSLVKRGDSGPAWSITWKMSLWAHLHNSEHAYNLVRLLITLVDPDHEIRFKGGLYSNLFTAHPPFQIDGNFGFTTAIAEMLVQSTEQDLYLLPAVPLDKWGEGCVTGLKARGNVTVSICWKGEDLYEASLWSQNQDCVKNLHYKGTVATVTLYQGNVYIFDRYLRCVKTSLLKD